MPRYRDPQLQVGNFLNYLYLNQIMQILQISGTFLLQMFFFLKETTRNTN